MKHHLVTHTVSGMVDKVICIAANSFALQLHDSSLMWICLVLLNTIAPSTCKVSWLLYGFTKLVKEAVTWICADILVTII
jgi:hypothetical protein